jgi:hypothetical protein
MAYLETGFRFHKLYQYRNILYSLSQYGTPIQEQLYLCMNFQLGPKLSCSVVIARQNRFDQLI